MSGIDQLYWEDSLGPSKSGIERAVNPKGAKKSKSKKPQQFWLPDCRHWRQRFELDDGLHVYASSWMDRPDWNRLPQPQGFEGEPDIGFYLESRWASDRLMVSPGFRAPFVGSRKAKAKVIVFPWPDYGVPDDPRLLLRAIKWLLSECRTRAVVEVGCMGGHGRTGTVLAAMLILQGLSSKAATRRVWRRYCEEAIESEKQLAFLRALI